MGPPFLDLGGLLEKEKQVDWNEEETDRVADESEDLTCPSLDPVPAGEKQVLEILLEPVIAAGPGDVEGCGVLSWNPRGKILEPGIVAGEGRGGRCRGIHGGPILLSARRLATSGRVLCLGCESNVGNVAEPWSSAKILD